VKRRQNGHNPVTTCSVNGGDVRITQVSGLVSGWHAVPFSRTEEVGGVGCELEQMNILHKPSSLRRQEGTQWDMSSRPLEA
jgi:hypothetical protein